MIVSSVLKTLKTMVFRPHVFLIMAIVAITAQVVSLLSDFALEKPAVDLILYGNIFTEGDFLAIMFSNYPEMILLLVILGIIMLTVLVIGLVSIAKFASGESLSKSVNHAVSNWKSSLSLTIALFLLFIIVFGIFYLLGWVTAISPDLSFVFFLLWFILTLLLVFKLIFVFPALSEKKMTAKKALIKSWEFTNKKILSTIAFLILVFLVGVGIILLGSEVSVILGEASELIVAIITEIILLTFIGLAVAYYYNSK